MKMKDICFSNGMRLMLETNGKMDCETGMLMWDGWQEVARLCDFEPNGRTPAREAYEDGYYSGKPPVKP